MGTKDIGLTNEFMKIGEYAKMLWHEPLAPQVPLLERPTTKKKHKLDELENWNIAKLSKER